MCEEKENILIEVWGNEFTSNPELVEHELYQAVTGGV